MWQHHDIAVVLSATVDGKKGTICDDPGCRKGETAARYFTKRSAAGTRNGIKGRNKGGGFTVKGADDDQRDEK